MKSENQMLAQTCNQKSVQFDIWPGFAQKRKYCIDLVRHLSKIIVRRKQATKKT